MSESFTNLELLDKAVMAIESSIDDIFKVPYMDLKAGEKLARHILDSGLMDFYKRLVLTGDTHDAGYFNGSPIGRNPDYPTGYYFRWIEHIGLRIATLLNTPSIQDEYLNKDKGESKRKIVELLMATGTTSVCSCCGRQYGLCPDINTMELRVINEKTNNCEFPQGFKDETIELDCSSGKLVFANDFRSISPYNRDAYSKYTIEKSGRLRNLNSGIGSVLMLRYQADLGIAYISTGNSCPRVFFDQDKNQIQIRTGSALENEAEMGSICTDLWAVQAMDYALFEQMCLDNECETAEKLSSLDAFVVDVPPGTYRVVEHCEYPYTKGFEEMSLFATFSLK